MALQKQAIPINFTLVSDTSPQTGGSAISTDQVLLATALVAGDVVVINQTYDSLFSSVQTDVFGDTRLFATSELARAFNQIPLNIALQGKALPGYDPTVVAASVSTALQALIEPGVWQGSFQPQDITQSLQSTVSGLASPVLTQFQRSTRATATIETVVIQDNEIATFNPSNVVITINNS